MKKSALIGLVLPLFGSVLLTAQDVDVPLRNWTVPPYTLAASGEGLTTMTDVTPPRVFIGVAPCRVADTRGVGGFTGQAGPPALTTGPRTFQIAGTVAGVPTQCGIPLFAVAVSFQFTIVTPNTAGNLIAWPGGPAPSISVLNWSAGESALGNGTIVPLSPTGSLNVQINAAVGSATGHLVIDVNGYFAQTPQDSGNLGLWLTMNTNNIVALFENASTTSSSPVVIGRAVGASTGSAIGVDGETRSTGNDSIGVRGRAEGATGRSYGVWGSTLSSGSGAAGVIGLASSGTARGVYGINSSGANDSAGVYGENGGGVPTLFALDMAGVRGQTGGFFGLGVVGISQGAGVNGVLVSAVGGRLADGYLGTHFGVDPGGPAEPKWGVFAQGDIGASNTKYFVDPHPTDASKVIGYISLEGPEAGTYFRGRARFQRGLATIPVPEDFRLVTDPEGLTVQITPIGEMASFAVVRMGLDEIVVKGSRNVEFSYLVQGVRATWGRRPPIFEDGIFLPTRADATMPEWLTEKQKERLIQNGTYNADGTVNLDTARRNGWERMWAERARPAPAPSPE